MSDVTGTDIDDKVAQITQAERVGDDPSMKGTIAYYGSMLLLAKLGRIDKLQHIMPDLVDAMQLAIANIKANKADT